MLTHVQQYLQFDELRNLVCAHQNIDYCISDPLLRIAKRTQLQSWS
jgi:hypothetical protein